ncbi:MAG: MobF family relaxase [Lacisediminihabitans sp.]
MKSGVILFRASGTAARRYLESDRSQADEYYLEGGVALAEFSVMDGTGEVIGEGALTPEQYAAWVDWINPFTGESMGTPREAGDSRQGSPRFAEMVVNTPKSLSIAAALHPDVSEALDAAQKDAMGEIRRWLGQHSVTRVGPRGRQEVVPVEQLETVSVVHKTSRAGDPHRHIHFQIGTRVWAAGAWRGLDTAALFKQQGAIRALGTAVLTAHPQLAAVLDRHGLTLDPVTGEVAELEPFNAVMSKRGEQVKKNLARFQAEWEARHPGQEPGPVVMSRLTAMAWDHERPNKKPSVLGAEAGWRTELEDADYTPNLPRQQCRRAISLDDLRVQEVASRALDRCAAAASTWTSHTVQEHVTRITTEAGVRATPEALRDFIRITTRLAAEDCLSVLPSGTVQPDHVAHLTSVHVAKVETELRGLLNARTSHPVRNTRDLSRLARDHGLDTDQTRAAGAGKTTMLGAAIQAAAAEGRATRIVTPTKKAAQVARQELGVAADSVAKLVHAHGWRWNRDGVWTRLAVGQSDPETGITYNGPLVGARLRRGERIVVDEAGMLDQDTALALLRIADEAGATLALLGDRAQLPAVGRGGVLDMAAQLAGRTYEMTTVHRFTDPEYADLTVRMRAGENPALLFDQLHTLGLVRLHDDTEHLHEAIAQDVQDGGAITAATNDEARDLNALIRAERVRRGEVDDARTTTGSDGLLIGAGDVIQTRKNDNTLQVTNRQTWTVQHVLDDGTVWVKENASGRKHRRTVTLPVEYLTEHAHLAYASTAYGVQGATVQESHTVLSDALDAAGVYVGMTRGRDANQLHIVAADLNDAREQFTSALERDRADRGLDVATQAVRDAVAGLAADGPVRLVNTERARLVEQINQADQWAAKWQHAAAALDQQRHRHQVEADEQQALLATFKEHAEQIHAEVTAPLIERAMQDGTAYLATRDRMWEASNARRPARTFQRRAADRSQGQASQEHGKQAETVRRRWTSTPTGIETVPTWADTVAGRLAEDDPRVIDAQQQITRTQNEIRALQARQGKEREALRISIYGRSSTSSGGAAARANEWAKRAEQARRILAQIEALPADQAAALLREQAQARQAAERAQAERAAQGRGAEGERSWPDQRRSGPERSGFGR